MDTVFTFGVIDVILAMVITISIAGSHLSFKKFLKLRKEEKEAEKQKEDNKKEIKSIQ